MVLKNLAVTSLLLLGLALSARPATAATTAEVTLPLADYLAMVERATARERAAAARDKAREAPVAEVVEERIALRLEEKAAAIADSTFEVLIQGEPIKAVWLPLPGFGESVTITRLDAKGGWSPAATASLTAFAGSDGGSTFVAGEPGRYRIVARSRIQPAITAGKLKLQLLRVAAPVASAELDLPADLEWVSPGAVLVGEKVEAGRRRITLATQRGNLPQLLAWRRFELDEEKPLAHTVLLTLMQLRPEGLRRHDVILYEVSRGQLSAFEVELPPGLEIEQAATDEGPTLALADGRKLRIDRQRQLQGTGYLVLTSTPAPGAELPLVWPAPAVEVRARFLAATSTTAAQIGPQPATAFSQVDLEDLPPLLSQALGAVRLTAAWRLGDDKGPLALRLAPLPPAPSVGATVRERQTTTLLTIDGTLLHQETFLLAPTDRPASSFELTLPPGAILWSTRVDDQPVRPLQKGGKLVLPILPRPGQGTRIEVVAVCEQAIAPGRSQLAIELAQVESPVLEHGWRLLLPDGPKYRYAAGELLPVPAGEVFTAGRRQAGKAIDQAGAVGYQGGAEQEAYAAKETVTVTAESPLLDERKIAPSTPTGRDGDKRRKRLEKDESEADVEEGMLAAANYSQQVNELQQGLVGGVKPLPITIPESGKALVLTGVLPPQRVGVTIDVKAKK